MPSKAPPEAQIIVRCKKHPPTGQAVPYIAAVHPVGDGLALRCRCYENPGLVWFTEESWRLYLNGTRDFRPRTRTVVVRVGETVAIRPK